MAIDFPDHIYSEEDIYKAYDIGLQFAIDVFEGSIGFTPENQLELVERLKESISSKEKSDKPTCLLSLDLELF